MKLKRATRWMPPEEYDAYWIAFRLERTVRGPGGCLIWTGPKTYTGYGTSAYHSRPVRVHRKMLELKLGRPLEPNHDACHTCDVRLCINQDHLWEGTRKQNMEDCLAKRRHDSQKRTHCPRGHEYTPENTIIRPPRPERPNGARSCRECSRIRGLIYHGSPIKPRVLAIKPKRKSASCHFRETAHHG